jgi:hypothetical protein
MKYVWLLLAYICAVCEGLFAVPCFIIFALLCAMWQDGAFVPGKPVERASNDA